MKLPLINNDTEEIQIVDTKDILFVVRNHPGVVIHTQSNRFRPFSTVKEFYNFLSEFGFDYVEQSTIANLDKITRYDPDTRIAYFDKAGHQSKACSVSRRNAKKVK